MFRAAEGRRASQRSNAAAVATAAHSTPTAPITRPAWVSDDYAASIIVPFAISSYPSSSSGSFSSKLHRRARARVRRVWNIFLVRLANRLQRMRGAQCPDCMVGDPGSWSPHSLESMEGWSRDGLSRRREEGFGLPAYTTVPDGDNDWLPQQPASSGDANDSSVDLFALGPLTGYPRYSPPGYDAVRAAEGPAAAGELLLTETQRRPVCERVGMRQRDEQPQQSMGRCPSPPQYAEVRLRPSPAFETEDLHQPRPIRVSPAIPALMLRPWVI